MDHWRFTLTRVVIFFGLLGHFGVLGGFELFDGGVRQARLWLLFFVGAACATMGDQTYGNLDRASLRFFYLWGGIGLMIFALCLLNTYQLFSG